MRKTHNTGHQGSPHANDETSVRLSWHCQLAEIPFIVYVGLFMLGLFMCHGSSPVRLMHVCNLYA